MMNVSCQMVIGLRFHVISRLTFARDARCGDRKVQDVADYQCRGEHPLYYNFISNDSGNHDRIAIAFANIAVM